MPNPRKGARLYLKKRKGRPDEWIIRHTGRKDVFTGCGPDEGERADKALADYLAAHFQPDTTKRDLAAITVGEVMTLYITDVAPNRTPKSAETLAYHVKALLSFWGDKTLDDVRGSKCRAYVKARPVKPATARLELKDLQTAINHWARENHLPAVPQVTLPEPGASRERFLERAEVAAMLRACRKLKLPHVARFILIGIYTGTRHATILNARWEASLSGGHFDISRGLFYRRGSSERETSKRRPVVSIPARLRHFVQRWRWKDKDSELSHVITYKGLKVAKMKRAWASVVKEAGLGRDVTPHVLRHTFITWELWKGTSIWDVAGMAGASATMIERVYGHHRPVEEGRKAA